MGVRLQRNELSKSPRVPPGLRTCLYNDILNCTGAIGQSLADYASWLAGLIKTLGVGPVHLCGLSWGGVVALQMYADHPYLVKDLVFADTYAGWKGSLSHGELQARISGTHRMLGASRASFDPNLRGLFAGRGRLLRCRC